ncbi:MAG: GAF domain-containing protein [Gramella sp.]|nr:GAF domain-containing protein [Christiangramia sp.]
MLQTKTEQFDSEFQRIKKLSELDLDYLEMQDEVKNLVEVAGIIAGTEFSLLNFIDNHIQWTISPYSNEVRQTPREESICDHTIKSRDYLEIKRLDLDERFSNRDYTKGENGLKYYLGFPLTMDSGENIGALCVVDREDKHLPDSSKKALKLIATEIVEKLEKRKKLNETNYALAQTERIKNQIAHDVRGPVHGMSSLAEIVESEDLSSEEMKEYFKLIKESGRGVIELTDEILNSYNSKPAKNSGYLSVKQLKEKLKKLYQLPCLSKNLDFQVITEPEHENFTISKQKLLGLIGNLISNAIKFTPSSGTVRVLLAVANINTGRILKVVVKDSGSGINTSEIQDIYDDSMDSKDGTAGEKGFGLGLKLVREMVNDLHGEMHIASGKKEGTKIELRLPLK